MYVHPLRIQFGILLKAALHDLVLSLQLKPGPQKCLSPKSEVTSGYNKRCSLFHRICPYVAFPELLQLKLPMPPIPGVPKYVDTI
jgi:hypothetical protein